MPQYEFRVLCADSGESCDFVKGLMKDFDHIKTVGLSKPYDHVGIIDVDNSNMALLRKRELKEIAGNSVLNIEVALVQ